MRNAKAVDAATQLHIIEGMESEAVFPGEETLGPVKNRDAVSTRAKQSAAGIPQIQSRFIRLAGSLDISLTHFPEYL